MIKTTLTATLVSAAVLGLAACDVKKTQEGSVDLPKYDVKKTQEGNVQMPKYDVKGPDVQVGSKEETVKVPTVRTEEKKVEVPTVSVTTPKEKEQQQAQKP
jgi:uncharacterized lipoprotein